jgi:hypothetical protein
LLGIGVFLPELPEDLFRNYSQQSVLAKLKKSSHIGNILKKFLSITKA